MLSDLSVDLHKGTDQLRGKILALDQSLLTPATPIGRENNDEYTSESLLDLLGNPNLELNQQVDEIISLMQPSRRTEIKRVSVVSFIKCLVRKCLGAQLYSHGSYALKTYFEDSSVDVSVFFSQAYESTWVQRVLSVLCEEACAVSINSTTPYKVKHVMVTFPDNISSHEQPEVSCSVQPLGSSSPVVVRIHSNRVTALAEAALSELMDATILKNHLFKRSLLLTQAWARCHGALSITA